MNTTTQQATTTTTREPIDLDTMLDEANRAMQRVSAAGQDTRALKAHEKENILAGLAKALGLNPLSSPVRFLPMQGGEVLYVTRQGTDQIAARLRLNRETTMGPEVRTIDGHKVVFCQVRVTAPAPDGRSEMATATLPLKDITNDLMKCETKAKRRATLSLAGLGLLSEEETETIPGTVTLVRDDAPAQHAAPDALDAFRAALADATDLAGIVAVYQRADLGGTSAKPVTDAVIERAAVLGYYLNGVEAKALLGGTLDATLTTAYERLADVTRHADDEDGDGVVADIVRIVRDYRSEAKPITTRVWSAAAGTAAYHLRCDEESAKQRLTAALTPPPPPTAGAQASVADGGLIMGLDGWREYLAKLVAAQVPVFAIAGSFHKHRAAFADAGVLEQRRAETLAAIEAREGRGPEAARQALDGYATRRVMPAALAR